MGEATAESIELGHESMSNATATGDGSTKLCDCILKSLGGLGTLNFGVWRG